MDKKAFLNSSVSGQFTHNVAMLANYLSTDWSETLYNISLGALQTASLMSDPELEDKDWSSVSDMFDSLAALLVNIQPIARIATHIQDVDFNELLTPNHI